MRRFQLPIQFAIAGLLILIGISSVVAKPIELTPKQQLGKRIAFDKNLSEPRGQDCMVCHGPAVGFTGPDEQINKTGSVYRGAVPTRFGNRKPPSNAYASFSPKFHYDAKEKSYMGGQFWDGRAATLADQAKGPFLNPVEQNNPNGAAVVEKIRKASYAKLFKQVYGPNSLDDPNKAYDLVADTISAYESSPEVNKFNSKFDEYLDGKATLTPAEQRGLRIFEGKGKCSSCHTSRLGENGAHPVFTNFTYENLGVPKNPQNPFYSMPPSINPEGAAFIDRGLGAIVKDPAQDGKVKVPTLRNVDKRPHPNFVKAYTHNGYFKSLPDLVHFYNTRDVGNWPPPEVPQNINKEDVGNLNLTSDEEANLVAFLKTLSDR